MSVKVATRVRPYNDREKGLNATLCIDMVWLHISILDSKYHCNN